jgi:hypothetical protein
VPTDVLLQGSTDPAQRGETNGQHTNTEETHDKGTGEDEQGHTLSLSLSLSYSLSRTRSLATLVTPTTSTLVQDNTRLIPPLVFHLAPIHLGRDTQRQIY